MKKQEMQVLKLWEIKGNKMWLYRELSLKTA
jgi:hypothetical protein